MATKEPFLPLDAVKLAKKKMFAEDNFPKHNLWMVP